MRLSEESRRGRYVIMAVALALGAVIIFAHVHLVRRYVDTAGALGLRGESPSTPLTQVYPAFAADAQTWVRHALALTEGESVRLRFTTIDNAPDGREVHWNSAWAWAIAGAGYLQHWVTGLALPHSIERGTLWLPGVVLLLLAAAFGLWTSRRAGALAGAIVVMALVGHSRIYEGFFPSYADHHGLMTLSVAGLVLGAVFMGAGWWRPRDSTGGVPLLPSSPAAARGAAAVSAASGSLGLWVTAASVIPPIVIVGTAGLVAGLVAGRRAKQAGGTFDGTVWRVWGRVGAIGSLVFYLLEYFPDQIGLRLEANHPLYGLAWLGGGEIIAQLGERLQRERSQWLEDWPNLIAPLVAVSLAPLVILVGGSNVFVIRDPFLAELHHLYIAEFLPLWRSLRGKSWSAAVMLVGVENIPLFVGLVVLAVRRTRGPLVVWFATITAAGFSLMAVVQSRWLLNASGAQVALVLVLTAYLVGSWRPARRWAFAGIAITGLFVTPAVTRIIGAWSDVSNRRISPADAGGALSRDIAKVIRASQPEGKVVLLTNPNSSTNVGYFGRFQTLGTLYWENLEGLKAAAEIFSATDPRRAAVLVRQHGITHIAMISEENFIAQYHRLLNPAATESDVRRSFGHQLLVDKSIPAWLQLIPYTLPEDLAALKTSVLLFRVAFEQTPADALYNLALAKIAMGNKESAEQDLDILVERSPQSFQPWLRKGELLFARQEWEAAAEALLQGIRRAPPSDQMQLLINTAGSFFRAKQHRLAAKLYLVGLESGFQPTLAGYLSYVLSTTTDDSLRNGATALALAERALQQEPGSTALLNAHAAALAELGRFQDAIAVAGKAAAVARERGDQVALIATQQRLAYYREGKPWRE